jgi:hypothetical protein
MFIKQIIPMSRATYWFYAGYDSSFLRFQIGAQSMSVHNGYDCNLSFYICT